MFEGINPRLREALETQGLTEPTEPQRLVVPHVLSGRHVLLLAPTGSGKTEGAMIPIFHRILEERPTATSAVYVTPLRALNRDMLRRLRAIGEAVGIRVAVRHGDTPRGERTRQVKNPPDVLITTPETLQILFTGSRTKEMLRHVRWVVVDEVHELAGDERGAQLSIVLERLASLCGEFQRIGLSATVGNPEEVAAFLGGVGRNVEIIVSSLTKERRVRVHMPSRIHAEAAEAMACDPKYASSLVDAWEMASAHTATLFFVNTRRTAEDVALRYRLWRPDIPIEVHHGSLSAEVRVRAEEGFKSGTVKMLICTSSLELGIDVGHADFVIQFNSPRQVSKLVQRVGRAGHSLGRVSEGVIVTYDPVEAEEGEAIAALAERGWIEPVRIREKPMVSLANQIASEAYASRRVNARRFYETVRRAHPYRGLTWEEFESLLSFLASVRVIWYDAVTGEFGGGRKTRIYFVDNISLIPDERIYWVVDMSTGRKIGTVDERFVATEAEAGRTFVMRGMAWRIVKVEEDRILVQYVRDVTLPPKWVGEEIPVPFEVAMEVGRRRREGLTSLREVEEWREGYLATDETLLVEWERGRIVMQMPFGTRTNYAIGSAVSALLAARTGYSVNLDFSPYHIALEVPPFVGGRDAWETLLTLAKEGVLRSVLRMAMRRTRAFRYAFLYVAKKMGVLGKGADMRSVNFDRMIDAYRDTPLYEETLAKCLWDYMDVERAEEVLRDIAAGKFRVEFRRGIGDAARRLMENRAENVRSLRPTKRVLEMLRRRLMEQEVTLYCLSCRRRWHRTIEDLPDRINCPYCGGVRVAALMPYQEEWIDEVERHGKDERKVYEKMITISHLIREHGRVAAMVLAARGVGPERAARVLSIPYDDEEELLLNVLRMEEEYVRTRDYWD